MDTDRPPDIVVIAGGAPVHAERVTAVAPGTRIIAADAGVAAARTLGWEVDVAVGDFDSLPPADVDRLDELAEEVRRFPRAKDATDLELALSVAAESAPARVLVVGIEGGRPDHALANLLVTASHRFAALEVEITVDGGRAWVVGDRLTGVLPSGSLVSAIPVHGEALVSVDGVRWPLDHRTLEAGTTLGISNEIVGPSPFVLDVHSGVVICIAPRDHRPHDSEVHP